MRLRHHEAHEPDGPGHADDGADDRGAREERAALEGAHVDPEALRRLVAEREHVDARRVGEQHGQPADRVERHEAELRPRRGVEEAHEPPDERLQPTRLREGLDEQDARVGDRVDDDPREQDRRAPARARARPSVQTSAVAPTPPAKDATGTLAAAARAPPPTPATMAMVAPSAAPPETPRMYGSASGLRSTAWNAAPTAASPAPATAPSRTRGSR